MTAPMLRSTRGAGPRGRRGVLAAACIAVLFACGPAEEPAPPWPSAVVAEPGYDFGSVVQGERIEHAFVVENRGLEELRIEAIDVPEMVEVVAFDEVVPPRGRGEIRLALDTAGRSGRGRVEAPVTTNDPESETLVVWFEGRLVSLVEVRPQNRVYFFDVATGQSPEQEVLLVNHQDRPLQILEVQPGDPSYFFTRLETVRDGQEYRLTVRLDPTTPAGRWQEDLEIRTDSPELPVIPVYARARVLDEVFFEPEHVSFSRFPLEEVGIAFVSEREIRIATMSAEDFEVLEASTDIAFLKVEVEAETPGRSYRIRVRIDPELAERGELRGTLSVRTNHADFPTLEVPITGALL